MKTADWLLMMTTVGSLMFALSHLRTGADDRPSSVASAPVNAIQPASAAVTSTAGDVPVTSAADASVAEYNAALADAQQEGSNVVQFQATVQQERQARWTAEKAARTAERARDERHSMDSWYARYTQSHP